MSGRKRSTLTVVIVAISVIGRLAICDRAGIASEGSAAMGISQITVEHVHVASERPFDQVTKAFESRMR